MPKGRHSRGYADGPGGGGGGGYAPGGPGVEPQAIPSTPPPVIVEEYSRTRHQMEPLRITFTGTGGAGRVTSSSGREYETTPDSCTCPDFVMRRRECRHIRAMRRAMGLPPLDAGWQPGDNTPARDTVQPEIANPAHEQEENVWQQLMQSRVGVDERFVSEDEDLWNEYVQAAQNTPPVYQTENVLDGPDGNTFGVEIEFVGGNREAIARELYAAGLTRTPRQEGYHAGRSNTSHWRFERDSSVDGEVVSPPLRDTPEAWEQIRKVCEIIKRHGGRVDARCGGHVHIGKAPLDENVNRKYRLERLVKGFEDIYFRMASSGELNGRHRGTNYVTPIGRNWGTSRPRSDREAENRLNRGSHYAALNAREHTVEFRYFNGSLTPEQIQANIILAYNTVKAAATENRRTRRGRIIPEGNDSPMAYGHSTRNGEDMAAVKRFFDIVMARGKDKIIGLRSFLNSRWQGQES